MGIYGTLLFGKNYPVAYLPDSAGRFFRAGQFTRARSFFLGAVTLYTATKG
ncbi:MAG: hypothetical protein HYT89_00900 [Candidatus Omnitrophica bacterium]|nr:hypothetical protein [Candidatus Omnitrophota bacterium]